MTPQQVNQVRASFNKIVPIANRAAALFYDRLFETAPETRALFRGDIDTQGRKLDSDPRRSERIEIVDWGCGYGRDSLYFLELGFDVIGIDVSEKAVALARGAYKQRQASGIPLLGASFHAGDLHSVFNCRTGQRAHAFFSNRVLHLLSEIDFREAARDAMTCMEKGAYFCVSARSSDDFNTAIMEWVPGKEQEVALQRSSEEWTRHNLCDQRPASSSCRE